MTTSSLERFLGARRLAELQEFWLFWEGRTAAPEDREDLVRRLALRMSDEGTVHARWKVLPPRHREVMTQVAWDRVPVSERPQTARPTGSIKPPEFEAAAHALLKRGFLMPGGNGGKATTFTVPEELGRIVREITGHSARPLRVLFTLAGFLDHGGADADGTEAAAPEAVRRRLAEFRAGPLGPVLDLALTRFGGLLTRSLYERVAESGRSGTRGLPPWDRGGFGKALEEARLGTTARLSLEEYGINLVEDALIVFEEVLEAELWGRTFQESDFTAVRDPGGDLLSDLARLIAEVRERPFKVTRDRGLGRTARKRLKERMVFPEVPGVDREELVDFLFRFADARGLLGVDPAGTVRPTREAEGFLRSPLPDQTRALFQHAERERAAGERDFHFKELKRLALARLPDLAGGGWVDALAVPHAARARYLATLEERGVRDSYLSRFQYSVEPPREDVAALSWRLVQFLTGRLHAMGLLEAAFQGAQPVAFRLSALGRRVLGLAAPREAAPIGNGLVVNPDFEVLVLPEARDAELLYALDRFAERLQSDRVVRFRITRERVKAAVSAGLGGDRIVELLASRAGPGLPQNVQYSIQEWAGEVRFVRARRSLILESEDPATLDQIAALPGLAELHPTRLTPNLLALDPKVPPPEVVQELRQRGIHFK